LPTYKAEHTLPKQFSDRSGDESHLAHQGTEKVTEMRKLLISILLASVAASPAIARPQHDDGDNKSPPAHQQHQQAHDEGRGNRGGDNGQRAQFQVRQQMQVQQNANRGGWDRGRFEGRGNVTPQQVQQQAYGHRDGNFDGRRRDGYAGVPQQGQVVEGQRNWSRDRTNWNQNRDGDWRQRGTVQTQYRDRSRWANGGWNRDWRNDRRYDWRRYRDHHRSVFHLGIYFDPFGYGYREFGIGYRLQPVYFGQQYWIDPAMYGLPFPPPGAQWVRYWNDAVLVDMYSGEVIDVIHDFFW
jgi:Ni/Co efflux regulator RcnB